MTALGPGGLCEELTSEELAELVDPIRDLALAALAAGRRAHLLGERPTAAGPRVAVTGGEPGYARQLARLLGDLDYRAEYLPDPVELAGAAYLVHLGAEGLTGVLSAAEQARVERLVYVGSAQVYRGSGEQPATEDSVTGPPGDPVALGWWRAEEQCRAWAERTGIELQVLRAAEPVGPNVAPGAGTAAQWMHQVWTRHPLRLHPQWSHQVLDYRDLAEAIGAVLASPAKHPVLNLASAVYQEEELAELVAVIARRTAWERLAEPRAESRTMSTDLIRGELGWQSSAVTLDAMRAMAQWLACDTHYPEDLDG
jgi:nucleoside-diphosphate-sugar epimerase